jgi:alkylation response protein AidB-like acyl-CoA dehydrogenase
MDFDFNDEQIALREAVQRWVERAYDFERRQRIVAAGGFDHTAWSELVALGLTGLTIDPAHGGMGLGPVDAMVAMEALGHGLVLEPVAQALLAAATLQHHSPAAMQAEWLPRIAGGELVVLAHVERHARHRWDDVHTQARADGAGWRLHGRKHVVPAGDHAAAWLVPARRDGQLELFLVRRDAPGASVRAYPLQDGSRGADLELQDTPAERVSADGEAALAWAIDVGIALQAAQAVGVMDRTLALTLEYLNTRKQFGVPIGSFQALRHRAADMKMQLELARSMSYYATLKLHAEPAVRRQALARAKVQLGQSMRFVGQQAVQLHGGIGVTDEYIVSHCFKVLTQMELSFGDTLHHLGEVAARMTEEAGVSS